MGSLLDVPDDDDSVAEILDLGDLGLAVHGIPFKWGFIIRHEIPAKCRENALSANQFQRDHHVSFIEWSCVEVVSTRFDFLVDSAHLVD